MICSMKAPNADQFDAIDRRIVAALSADARLSLSALAEKVGLSKTPVQARLKKLEAAKVIRGYAAIVGFDTFYL